MTCQVFLIFFVLQENPKLELMLTTCIIKNSCEKTTQTIFKPVISLKILIFVIKS
jgi:hypothetical protein